MSVAPSNPGRRDGRSHRAALDALDRIVAVDHFPLDSRDFQASCRERLRRDGCLTLPGFLPPQAVAAARREGLRQQHLAYYCTQRHTAYLSPPDPDLPEDHPRNRYVTSSKGCITDDQISMASVLRTLYDAEPFRAFLRAVLDEDALYPYADPLSSINIHYASEGQELGWHFDNSSFAVTLLLQAPEAGGTFEYVRGLRDSNAGDMNYEGVRRLLDGETDASVLEIEPGALVLFRGRDSAHRVAPVAGRRTRMLAVLAYNTEPGIALSESARMTFYGRLGQ